MIIPNVGDSVNVRLCINCQTPSVATVTSVDALRRLVGLTYTSGAPIGSYAGNVVGMDMVKEQNDAQFPLPIGTVWT